MLAFKPHKSGVFQLAFSPDGASVVTSGKNPTVCVSDATTGKVRWAYDHPGVQDVIGLGVAFPPDGSKVATVTWSHTFTFDAADGHLLHQRPGRGYAVLFAPDGEGVVASSATSGQHPAVTNPTTFAVRPLPSLGTPHHLNRLAFSPDGAQLAALQDYSLDVIDFRSGDRLLFAPLGAGTAGCGALAFHPHGRTLAYSDGAKLFAYDFDTKTGTAERKRSRKHIQEGAFTPDGKHFITVSNDETAVLWETGGWTEVREFAWQIGKLKTVAVSPDGDRAACGSDRGRVVVWDLE